MTLNYLLIIFFIYVILCFTVIYTLIKANHWVNDKQRLLEELSIDVPEHIDYIRAQMKEFNYKLEHQYIPAPLSSQEIGSLVSDIVTDIVRSRIPFNPIKNKFVIFTTLFKVWKFRHRLKATLMSKGT